MLAPIWPASFRAGTTTATDGQSASLADGQSSRSVQRQKPPRAKIRYNQAANAIAASTMAITRHRASEFLWRRAPSSEFTRVRADQNAQVGSDLHEWRPSLRLQKQVNIFN